MQKNAIWSICHVESSDRHAEWLPAQMLKIMRLLTFFLFAVSLAVSGRPSAQTVTISGKSLTLEQVFYAIEKQTGYLVLSNEDVFRNRKALSLAVSNLPLHEFLNMVLKDQQLKYAIEDKTIIISRKTKVNFPLASSDRTDIVIEQPPVTGRVTDSSGAPLVGATVTVRGKKHTVATDGAGRFVLEADAGDVLNVSFVGYETVVIKLSEDREEINVVLKPAIVSMEDVEVVINTGYQKLQPNEMAGAVDVITKKMLMEQTGNTVMERLVGMSGSLNFSNKVLPANSGGNPNSVLNMTIRGYSTINGTTDPLIIVNNFPYTGDIDNLDPNDIENIVILKDAAATAMWGIRAANGVIVITTSGSKFNQKTRVNFRTTTTITPQPDLDKVDVATDPEVYDFIAKYRGNALAATINPSTVVPEIDYLGWQYYKKGLIGKDEFDAQLDVMKALDPKKQWSDLLYRTGNAQNYSLNVSGGSENLAWTIAGSFDQGVGVLQAKSNRSNIRMNTIYKLTDKLSVELGIAYTSSFSKTGAPAYNTLRNGSNYMVTRPLVNTDGSPYGWWIDRSPIYMDTVGAGLYGDLKFYALEDWKHNYTNTNLTGYVKNFSIKYSPFKDLDISGNVQSIDQSSVANNISDKESYFGRYYMALNSEINRTTKAIKYHIPIGEFRRIRNSYANSLNARIDINYKRSINHGMLLFNGAFDVSESQNLSDGMFLAGYNEMPRSYVFMPTHTVYSSLQNANINTASINMSTGAVNIANLIAPMEVTQRNISTTASLSYVYDDRIIFNANARRDGANIIGVNVNERWKPNYSLALNWKVHKEKFFNLPLVSSLSTGISFGYLGNVDVSKSSRIVASQYNYSASYTDVASYLGITIPPNPELRWEKTAHTNFKFDVGLFNDRFQVRTNYFIKKISDLYLGVLVDPLQALPGNYMANAGKMNVRGYEINIDAKIIQSKIKYDITFTTAKITEKLEYYPSSFNEGSKLSTALMGSNEGFSGGALPLFKNMPLFSIFSLEGAQGVNSQGEYFINYKGKEYKNWLALYSDISRIGGDLEEVKFYGTGTPKFTGSMHHRFNYMRFTLLVSLQAELGNYLKYPKDIASSLAISSQYYSSWKKLGDELTATAPNYEDPSMELYQYFADYNILKGGVIRLNNIQLNYEIPTKKLRTLNLALNIQNLGKIWTANKEGYDYQHLNYMTYNGQNKYYAFTLNIGL